ncbi:MAG: AAA family ATPase [Chloracidobacterium sp.]|nr:AAA family ATPase [Chloracidobacterium sp.]
MRCETSHRRYCFGAPSEFLKLLSLHIPDPSLILLIGPSGAGKSTFAARHFKKTEIISSDRCRAMVCDDESDQSVNGAAFGLLHHIARVRLAARRLAVIDATNLETKARRRLLRIACGHCLPSVAVVFDVPLKKCLERNLARPDRVVNEDVIISHAARFDWAVARLRFEGYARLYILNEVNLNEVVIERI